MDRTIINGKIQTQTGRTIPVFPRRGSIKSIDKWLLEQAINEADSKRDDYCGSMFKHWKPDNLSPADRDSLNDYLFNETYPVFSEVRY